MPTGTGTESVDVVIAGAGSAAFAAALACRERGAEKVVLLEKAPEPEFGGNPRFSHSGFRWVQSGRDEIREFLPNMDDATFDRMQFRPYTEDDFNGHIGRATRGQMKPELQQALVGESNAAVHWLLQQGLTFQPDSHVEVDGKIYFEPGYSVHPEGGGIGQLHQLRALALAKGIQIRYESKVAGLIGDMHRLGGVRVLTPDGGYDLLAPRTFLCAGGFQANAAMRARYLGPNADLMKVRGSKHNTGEVLHMALDLGARSSGHWQMGHSSVVDGNSPKFGVQDSKINRYSYPYGISVNTQAQRFVDEGSNLRMLTYARMGWITLAEPEGMAWQLFDQKVASPEQKIMRAAYQHAPMSYEANSIRELAEKIDVNPDVLEHTVSEFNAACPAGATFDATEPDGNATNGIYPPKSNWAIPLDEPPFLAYPVTAGITFTFGGVEINENAQVLNTGGQPIGGLYASGDIVGLFYHGYVGSTGQTRNVVLSRRGAAHAMP